MPLLDGAARQVVLAEAPLVCRRLALLLGSIVHVDQRRGILHLRRHVQVHITPRVGGLPALRVVVASVRGRVRQHAIVECRKRRELRHRRRSIGRTLWYRRRNHQVCLIVPALGRVDLLGGGRVILLLFGLLAYTILWQPRHGGMGRRHISRSRFVSLRGGCHLLNHRSKVRLQESDRAGRWSTKFMRLLLFLMRVLLYSLQAFLGCTIAVYSSSLLVCAKILLQKGLGWCDAGCLGPLFSRWIDGHILRNFGSTGAVDLDTLVVCAEILLQKSLS
mmetsp:Transcript_40099/g.102618  ORF Transcript_40099/g.102618 Transcript_40099/m.102618 type:complete len:276 (+) Transcript_40099:199-1026(+)